MNRVQLNGRSRRARTLILLSAVALFAAGCASDRTRAESEDRRSVPATPTATATTAQIRTDVDPLKRRFPQLGELSGAKWVGQTLGKDSGSGVPGPTDVSLDGVVHIEPATLASITGGGTWKEQGIDCPVPGALAGELGDTKSAWLHSESFDRTVTQNQYSGSFYIDKQNSRVYFCTVNPKTRTD
ncbi:hypothetical protein ACFWXO_35565 [Kitasatospora sp. NPDC059088]|uniref:hypothetical protein n=1 Tax=Kitasatospora sp. NPDC059088 TaxID=3346722 RepID=UPI0036AF0BB7